jgi:endonuclease YncB( thermonuclease family)
MQTTTETNAATGAAGEVPATELSPEVQAARERIRQRLQAEVDAQGALPESRRAAALIGESSIRFTGDGDSDYVIVGPGGQPRHSLGDGSVPFSLRDLAAELRRNYPALFNPDPPPEAAAPLTEPIKALPQPRDWLMLGPGEASRPGEPAAAAEADNARIETDANAAAPSPPVVAPASRETETVDRRDGRTPLAETVPDILPPIGGFRPSYAIYGGVTFVLGVLLALMLWSLWSEPSPDTVSGQRASAGATPGPVAAPSGGDTAKPLGALSGVPEIVDTSTLRIDGRVVRLFGVEWERGAQAEDLTRYIAGREVVCTPAVRSDRHRCQIEGQDLSEVVLYNGGGRATSEATPELKTAEAKARAAGFGIWQKP